MIRNHSLRPKWWRLFSVFLERNVLTVCGWRVVWVVMTLALDTWVAWRQTYLILAQLLPGYHHGNNVYQVTSLKMYSESSFSDINDIGNFSQNSIDKVMYKLYLGKPSKKETIQWSNDTFKEAKMLKTNTGWPKKDNPQKTYKEFRDTHKVYRMWKIWQDEIRQDGRMSCNVDRRRTLKCNFKLEFERWLYCVCCMLVYVGQDEGDR